MARKIKLLVITNTDDGMHSNGPSHIVYVPPGVSASDAYVEWKLANLSDYEKKQEWAPKLHPGMTDEEWGKISFSMDVCMDDSKIWEVEIPGEAGDELKASSNGKKDVLVTTGCSNGPEANDVKQETTDMTGAKCSECGKGSFAETSLFDDMDGVLHCNKCGHKIDRYRTEKGKPAGNGRVV